MKSVEATFLWLLPAGAAFAFCAVYQIIHAIIVHGNSHEFTFFNFDNPARARVQLIRSTISAVTITILVTILEITLIKSMASDLKPLEDEDDQPVPDAKN